MEDLEKYAFENKADFYDYLRENGKTGVEAFIAAENYQRRLYNQILDNAELSSRLIFNHEL